MLFIVAKVNFASDFRASRKFKFSLQNTNSRSSIFCAGVARYDYGQIGNSYCRSTVLTAAPIAAFNGERAALDQNARL